MPTRHLYFRGAAAYKACRINAFKPNEREKARERAMAGHSQFKNIMHRKGRQDAAKSKLFGKLAREITVSAKIGLPDPAMNPGLPAATGAGRAENRPGTPKSGA